MSALARENPFASHRIENIGFRFQDDSWDGLLARLANIQYRASIIGPHGCGKTTLLEQLIPRLEALGFQPRFYRLNAETSGSDKERLLAEVRGLRAPELLLLDGAEQLSTRQWLPLRGAIGDAAGFIVTLHRAGRLPVVFECKSNPTLLEDIVEELTGGRLPKGEAAAIHHRYAGNIRDCLRELYDRWAGA